MKLFGVEGSFDPQRVSRNMAKRVEVHTPAPEIVNVDYQGQDFKLSELRGKKVLLVFNRGFL